MPMPGTPPPPPTSPQGASQPPSPVQQPVGSLPVPPAIKQMQKIMMVQQAISLLRQDKLRGFRIDIETDSTVQGDIEQEKQARTEFIQGVTQFIETAGTVGAQLPDFVPLASKLLQFGVRGFRVGRDLENAIDEFSDKAALQAKARANQPGPPNPELIKAQTEQMKAQAEIQRQAVENEGEKENALIDLQGKQVDAQMRQMEVNMKQMEVRMKEMELRMKEADLQAKHQDLQVARISQGDNTFNPKHIQMFSEAAKVFDLASRRHAAPKEIVRGPDGKAKHIITHFKEKER